MLAEIAEIPPGGPSDIAPPFHRESGFCCTVLLANLQEWADSEEDPRSSPVILLEDGKALGPAHSIHDDIRAQGGGRFSHWGSRLWFSTSDNSDPNTNGRRYSIRVLKSTPLARAVTAPSLAPNRRVPLDGPFSHRAGIAWEASVRIPGGDDSADRFRSTLCLYEDGHRLTAGHAVDTVITQVAGAYGHWRDKVVFSASDGSDPNTNGRVYSVDSSLDIASWNQSRLEREAHRWDLHSQGGYFRARGGDRRPPPLKCNLGLTNKCNLRCEICGSQKYLDASGVLRRHMELNVFEAVVETIFPFMYFVELNSQGDPLLYPHFEIVLQRIAEHRCDISIQHNGTLLTDRIIDLLMHQHGVVQLSLDAVGSRFDEVRRGGNWQKALPGLERFLRERDPTRLEVGAYPTLTERTIGDALNVVEWCADRGMDTVAFHRFWPLAASWEKAPSEVQYAALKDQLREWCAKRQDPLIVTFESESLNTVKPGKRKTAHAFHAKPWAIEARVSTFTFPLEDDSPDRDGFYLCMSPQDYVEIGLDGQISACCRAQEVALGYATSVEAFADAWLGTNYDRLRRSLERGASGVYPLPNCEACVNFFAPKAGAERRAIDYKRPKAEWISDGLSLLPEGDIRLERIHKDSGHCYVAQLPLGADASGMELWEDDRRLGPGGIMHDEIRAQGGGRYHIGPAGVYFSASDNTDPHRNDRIYLLRPQPYGVG
jgi:MoaA/NifB/PqqE/SkfB family radical SAM enzyme